MNKEAQNAYIKMILGNREIPNRNRGLADTVTAELLDRSYFNEEARCMEVLVNTYVKKTIAAKCGLTSASSVNTGINVLVNAGILTCIETGVYRFDPSVFGNMDWHTVTEASVIHRFGEGYENITKLNYGGEEVILKAAAPADVSETDIFEENEDQEEEDETAEDFMPAPKE